MENERDYPGNGQGSLDFVPEGTTLYLEVSLNLLQEARCSGLNQGLYRAAHSPGLESKSLNNELVFPVEFHIRRRFFRLPLSLHQRGRRALLNGVGKFVGQEEAAFGGLRLVAAGCEEDVLASGEGMRADLGRQAGCLRIGVQ